MAVSVVKLLMDECLHYPKRGHKENNEVEVKQSMCPVDVVVV